jgi:hypothetical protein
MAVESSVLVINYVALNAQLNTPVGDLWGWMGRKGRAALRGAQRQVGVKTGALRASLHMRHETEARGQGLWIGSDTVHYAYMHHQGTRPHVIAPRNAGGVLRMSSGRVVRGPVYHPGTRPNPFLTSQMYHFRY